MKRHMFTVTKREIFGKKLKKLRKEGLLPGNIYGKEFPSTAIQMPLQEFLTVYQEAGHSGIVDIKMGNETIPTLIHEVTHNHISHQPLHVDFYKVHLKEKVKATIPVIITGDPEAVTEKRGLLLQNLNEVEVEALPTDLPEHIEVDVTHLAQVGDILKVVDLKTAENVTILTDQETEVVRIAELVSREAEEQAQQEAVEAEAASTEGAEKEATPAEDEQKTEEQQTPEESKE